MVTARATVTGGLRVTSIQRITSPVGRISLARPAAHPAGTTVFWLIAGRNGRVLDAKVKSGISPELDQAATEALVRWKSEPATLAGKPHIGPNHDRIRLSPVTLAVEAGSPPP